MASLPLHDEPQQLASRPRAFNPPHTFTRPAVRPAIPAGVFGGRIVRTVPPLGVLVAVKDNPFVAAFQARRGM